MTILGEEEVVRSKVSEREINVNRYQLGKHYILSNKR